VLCRNPFVPCAREKACAAALLREFCFALAQNGRAVVNEM
jgi:hypothetical protein